MKIEFTIPARKQVLANRFCKYIIRWLQNDILKSSNKQKLQIRVDLLSTASWMKWNMLPRQLEAYSVAKSIVKCFEYKRIKNTYIIQLNPNRLFSNSKTPVERVARFLDKGNNIVKGSYFISNVTTKYQKSIYDYWRAFCLRSQL